MDNWFTRIWKNLVGKQMREIEEKAYNKPSQEVFAEKREEPKPVKIVEFPYQEDIHPHIKDLAGRILTHANAVGLKVGLFEGFRSFERQDFLYFKKKTTKARAGRSWHNYGLAVDIVFKDSKNRWTWSDKCDWKKLGNIGKKHGFIWGGDWGWDMAHFEWHPMFKNTKEALALYNQGGGKSVWVKVNEYLKTHGGS